MSKGDKVLIQLSPQMLCWCGNLWLLTVPWYMLRVAASHPKPSGRRHCPIYFMHAKLTGERIRKVNLPVSYSRQRATRLSPVHSTASLVTYAGISDLQESLVLGVRAHKLGSAAKCLFPHKVHSRHSAAPLMEIILKAPYNVSQSDSIDLAPRRKAHKTRIPFLGIRYPALSTHCIE